ncbi:MAG TPA: PKD domain-containing protein [Candidatus Saccharimonas sp.]|nr:PKD domain-containing protein [Candidatus Saccharimonas sp.]
MKTGLMHLIPHVHTGRLREHAHTSYRSLFAALGVVGMVLASCSWTMVEAAPPAVNPQSGSVGLSGTVRGPAPTQAAVITAPHDGQRFTSIPITVAGTCPQNTFVEIDKNAVFGGVTDCRSDGTFTLQVDLFDGQNTLIARVSDALGQFGPDSTPVVVFYDAPTLSLPGGQVGRQLFLESNVTVQGGSPGDMLTRYITIVGGTGPYAVSWDWGDGGTSLVSQAADGSTSASHSYERAGNYRVVVHVSDAGGNAALLQLVTVINGPTQAVGANGGSGLGALPGYLIAIWPLFLLALIVVITFWLGERREKRKLENTGRLLPA